MPSPCGAGFFFPPLPFAPSFNIENRVINQFQALPRSHISI